MLAILSSTLYLNITFYSLLRMLYFILLINPGKLLYHHANWCLGTLHCSYKYEESNMNMLNYGEDFINNIWICAIHHIPLTLHLYKKGTIGIDHDTVCVGMVGTAIRHSTSCAGRCAAACVRPGRHNECCAGLQYQPRQRRPHKWSISILPRSQFCKTQGKLAFSTSCTAVHRHQRLRNDAWRRDS